MQGHISQPRCVHPLTTTICVLCGAGQVPNYQSLPTLVWKHLPSTGSAIVKREKQNISLQNKVLSFEMCLYQQ